ncbi:unnamed protein product [Thlaspi arvense]|uniref:Mechanosensitive ion channel MscS domain-containing protein n=1 Tax=Thlaspi arvense TaxID=13288 RepID=A0AAU9RFM6_THLAR|nr:unnamed protein product [Thlaspi arvense]
MYDFSFLYRKNRSRLDEFDESQLVVDEEKKRFSVCSYLKWVFVAAISVLLALTLAISYLREKVIWGNCLWKWELSVLLVTGSRLACGTMVRVIVCHLHIRFRSCNRFLYVVYKIQHMVRRSLVAWLVVTAWWIVFGHLEVILRNQVLIAIDKFLISCAIFLSLWAMKSVSVMSLAAWFHMSAYHEKILESLFYGYVLEVLSGLPVVHLSSYYTALGLHGLQKFNPHGKPSWLLKKMMMGKRNCLATRIQTESDARSEAVKIFQNVADPSSKFIGLEDLKPFLPNYEALKFLKLFRRTYEDDENIQISLLSLQEWMVHSFKRHRNLILSLRDMDAASNKIDIIFSIAFAMVLAALAIPLLRWGGVKFLMALSVSSFVVTYFAGQVFKETYFSLQLLYIRHPFDVGDEVEIDEVEMFVEKLTVNATHFIGRRNKKKSSMANYKVNEQLVINNNRSEVPDWSMDDIV